MSTVALPVSTPERSDTRALHSLAPLGVLFVSEAFSVLALDAASQALKMVALGWIVVHLATNGRSSRLLLRGAVAVLLVLAVNLYAAPSTSGASEDLIRYLLPVILLLYAYSIRQAVGALATFLYVIALSNDVYQLYAYAAFYSGLPQLHEPIFDSGLLLRASGWLGSVMGLAYLNFACFVLASVVPPRRHAALLRTIFIAASLASFSFKLMPALALAVLLFSRHRLLWLGGAVAVVVATYLRFRDLIDELLNLVQTKIDFYLLIGNSARFESYRVAGEVIAEGNLLIGKGIGSFGGPASVKYDSAVYRLYDFRWYDTATMNTTDTFYPHLLVELGLLGAIVYMAFCLLPLYMARDASKNVRLGVAVLMFGVATDSLASFGWNAPVYLIAAYVASVVMIQADRVTRAAGRPA
jgi:hypothetical protein